MLGVTLALLIGFASASWASNSQSGWIQLASGQDGSYSWTVKAATSTDGPTHLGPCLSIAIMHSHGRFSYDRSRFRRCAKAPSSLRRSLPPLLGGGIHLGSSGAGARTVLGLVSTSGVHRVQVSFGDGSDAGVLLHPLPTDEGRARQTELRVGALSLAGARCIEKVTTQDRTGRALWAGVPDGCECRGDTGR